MSKKNIYVVPSKEGSLSWAVKVQGVKTPVSKHHTQKAAEAAGRPMAKQNKSELVTLGRDYKIRSKDSFGNESKVKDTEH
jgi:hypothetical protein